MVFDVNYSVSRLDAAAKAYEKRGFHFFANITETLKDLVVEHKYEQKLNGFAEGDTIDNKREVEDLVGDIVRVVLNTKAYLDPLILSDSYKLGALMTAEYNEKHNQTESAKKINELVLEIVKKEETIKLPFIKADEDIEKHYFGIRAAEKFINPFPSSLLDALVHIFRKNLSKLNDSDADKKFKDATDALLAVNSHVLLYSPLNTVEKLNEVKKLIPSYNQKISEIEKVLKDGHFSCNNVKCKKITDKPSGLFL